MASDPGGGDRWAKRGNDNELIAFFLLFFCRRCSRAKFPRYQGQRAHFRPPFFFLAEPGTEPESTRTASPSSLPLTDEPPATDPVPVPVPVSPSSSFMKSCWMVARRRSHHSRSASALPSMSSSFRRSAAFALISFADWKMVWPQPGARALACRGG